MKNGCGSNFNLKKEGFRDITNVIAASPAILEKAVAIEDLVYSIVDKVIKNQKKAVQSSRPQTNASQKSIPLKAINPYTPENILQRKVFDLKRWYCISRPQYNKSCGISSLTSCYNFLYSTLGYGARPILSQESMCGLLGYKSDLNQIKFDQFATNPALIAWFNKICKHFKISGKASMFYKPQGPLMTLHMTEKNALNRLLDGLQNHKKSFIYHCWSHYFIIIGYEIVPKQEANAYNGLKDIGDENDVWLLIADTYSPENPIISRRWSDIMRDLTVKFPTYIDIRHLDRGERQIQNYDGLINPHGIIVIESGF